MMALEIAMDELAEKLGLDPVELRMRNDTQVDPEKPDRPFSQRNLVRCLREGAERFGWHRRKRDPGAVRDGHWLVGMGMAAAFRNNLLIPSGARVSLERTGSSRRNRHDRHRHRQLYDHRADRRRDDGRRHRRRSWFGSAIPRSPSRPDPEGSSARTVRLRASTRHA